MKNKIKTRELDATKADTNREHFLNFHTASAYYALLHFLKRLRHHNTGALGLWVPGEDTSQTACTVLTTWPKSLRDHLHPVFYKASEASSTIQNFQREYASIERDLYGGFAEVHAISQKLPREFRGWARVGKYIDAYEEHAPSFIELFEKMWRTARYSDSMSNYFWASGDKFRKELAL